MIRSRVLLMCGVIALVVVGGWGATPEDERVSGYLADHGLGALLEVQLFDRLEREDAGSPERLEIADQLGAVYLATLGREGLSDSERMGVLAKGEVLVGLVPRDALLDLRLSLLVERYRGSEQAADLDRIGLLDAEAKSAALLVMEGLVPGFVRIRALSDGRVEALERSASRSMGEQLAEFERELSAAREVRSRASFFGAWAGYGEAVLSGRPVRGDVFLGFGWVLGFEGKLPVLDRIDLDLLEYDHVARAMIGLALCKMHNGDLREARVWLSAVEGSSLAPEAVVNFAHQRQLEVALLERDWIEGQRRAKFLAEFKPDSLLGVAQARLLVMRSLSVLGEQDLGIGGGEGLHEVARMGLDQLVELGEIGHVLELRERFGELPMLDSGFVGLYVQGLAAMGVGGEGGGEVDYGLAADRLRLALGAEDAGRYQGHSGDAALKLAFCELQLDRYGAAVGVLDEFDGLLMNDGQREESVWMQILALGGAISDGQDQMAGRFREMIGAYIRLHPSTERTNTLIVRYAMTEYLEAGVAIDALEIEDVTDPMAFVARRKLIQLMYKNPQLFVSGELNEPAALYGLVVEHARWLWANEPGDIGSLGQAGERVSVCRIVLGLGTADGVGAVDTGFLEGVIDRGESIVRSYLSLESVSSELMFRRVQVLLLGGEIDRAGEVVLSGAGVLDESVAGVGMLMVFERAGVRFEERPDVPRAQALIRYGRVVLGGGGNMDGGMGLDTRLSMVAEAMASAAFFLYERMGDELMVEYAGALSLRVFHEGAASESGLVLTGSVVEGMGHGDIAMECWLRLVGQVDESTELWHRARYESFRLLMLSDPARGRVAYEQYVALHPGGSPEPWGSKIDGLFSGGGP